MPTRSPKPLADHRTPSHRWRATARRCPGCRRARVYECVLPSGAIAAERCGLYASFIPDLRCAWSARFDDPPDA